MQIPTNRPPHERHSRPSWMLLFLWIPLLFGASTPAWADTHGAGRKWHDWFAPGRQIPLVGDFNGDRRDDMVTFLRDTEPGSEGYVYVSKSFGGFPAGVGQLWIRGFGRLTEIPGVGDFDGDGKDDIVIFVQNAWGTGTAQGDVWVALSNGSGFVLQSNKWHEKFSINSEKPLVGDFNGDGADDIVTFAGDAVGSDASRRGRVGVALSNRRGFGAETIWNFWFCVGDQVPAVGDVNADGRDDVLCFDRSNGNAWVGISTKDPATGAFSFKSQQWLSGTGPIGRQIPRVGDLNGDGRADVAVFVRGSGTATWKNNYVYVAYSTGMGFTPPLSSVANTFFSIGEELPLLGDVNGDGWDDLLTFVQDTKPDPDRGDVYLSLGLKPLPPPPPPVPPSGSEGGPCRGWPENACGLGLVCKSNTCVTCGKPGQPCCNLQTCGNDAACGANGLCYSSGCGGAYERCCSNFTCDNSSLACNRSSGICGPTPTGCGTGSTLYSVPVKNAQSYCVAPRLSWANSPDEAVMCTQKELNATPVGGIALPLSTFVNSYTYCLSGITHNTTYVYALTQQEADICASSYCTTCSISRGACTF